MKRLPYFLLALMLLASLAIPAAAAEEPLNMTAATSADGRTVTVTVTLTQKTRGSAMGITYTYDSTVAEPARDQCKWLKNGVLSDFSTTADQGVWAAESDQDLSGDICQLTFRVREGAKIENAAFGCVLEIQTGDGESKELRASVTASGECSHSYGPWEDRGEIGHSRSCKACGSTQTQSHSWDGGTVQTGSDGSRIKVTGCTVCDAEKTEVITGAEPQKPAETQPRDPEQTDTRPQPTFPTEKEETPEVPATEPEPPTPEETVSQETRPGASQNQKPEAPTEEVTHTRPQDNDSEKTTDPEEPHDHDRGNSREEAPTEPPMILPAKGTEPPAGDETVPETQSPSEEAPEQKGSPAALIAAAVLLALAAAGAGAALYLRRKK